MQCFLGHSLYVAGKLALSVGALLHVEERQSNVHKGLDVRNRMLSATLSKALVDHLVM